MVMTARAHEQVVRVGTEVARPRIKHAPNTGPIRPRERGHIDLMRAHEQPVELVEKQILRAGRRILVEKALVPALGVEPEQRRSVGAHQPAQHGADLRRHRGKPQTQSAIHGQRMP
ncbi:hypothetical protein [Ottowia sp. VDI28]|uniref:hypothetical protein n=1 Tax=Ottowia sp. VDI28 TaxID=3133968 RepID=UPI003C2AD65B